MTGAVVLGVNPPVHDFTFFDLWAKPLGLLFLLGFLRRQGNRVYLADCIFEGRTGELSFGRNAVKKTEIPKPACLASIPRRYRRFGLGEEDFRVLLGRFPAPDFILVTSMMTYWYDGVFSCIDTLRQVFPGVPVILGGVYARLCPEHAKLSGADMIQTEPMDLDFSLPATDLYRGLRYGVLATTFGCPFRCEYCASRLLEPTYRRRDPALVTEDAARQLSSGEVRDLAFYDDALLAGKERHLFPLLETLNERYPGIGLHTPNGLHVREIDDGCAEMLKKSGFQTLRLSFESSDPEMQHRGSDKTSDEEYLAALAALRKAGFSDRQLETYILAGVPGQSVRSVERSIRFVLEHGGKPRIAEFSPVPGTPSFEEAAVSLPALRDEPLLSNKTAYSAYLAGTMSPGELQVLKDMAKAGMAG
ncbi:MAG: radical SAM protein [Aminivibrio sp.]|nr:radical SAM protein [Aminivibrio sp.]